MSSNGQQVICSNKYGEIFISSEDVKNYMVKYLDFMIDDERIQIDVIDIISLSNQKFVFQMIINLLDDETIELAKIDHIRDSLDIIFRNHLGISFESINIGVKHLHD